MDFVSFVHSHGFPVSWIRKDAPPRTVEDMVFMVFSSSERQMVRPTPNHVPVPPPSAKNWDTATAGCSHFHRIQFCVQRPCGFLAFPLHSGRKSLNLHENIGLLLGTSAIFVDFATRMAGGVFARRLHSKMLRGNHSNPPPPNASIQHFIDEEQMANGGNFDDSLPGWVRPFACSQRDNAMAQWQSLILIPVEIVPIKASMAEWLELNLQCESRE